MTKKERNIIYKKWLEKQKQDHIGNNILYLSLCETLSNIKCISNENLVSAASLKDFPEIMKHVPNHISFYNPGVRYWFSCNKIGNDKRVSILEQAIKETE
jgi:hypothetical protein